MILNTKKLFLLSVLGLNLLSSACMKQDGVRLGGTGGGGNGGPGGPTEEVFNGSTGVRNNVALLNSMLLATGVATPNSNIPVPAAINTFFRSNMGSLPADNSIENVSPSETFATAILAAHIANAAAASLGSTTVGTETTRALFQGMPNNSTFSEANAVTLADRLSQAINRRAATAEEIDAAKLAYADVKAAITGNAVARASAVVIISGFLSSMSAKSLN